MIKMTIVTDSQGKLIGAVEGHSLSFKHGEAEAHVSFVQGHKLHKVEVDSELDMTTATDPAAFQEKLMKHVTG